MLAPPHMNNSDNNESKDGAIKAITAKVINVAFARPFGHDHAMVILTDPAIKGSKTVNNKIVDSALPN